MDTIIYGKNPVLEAFQSDRDIEKVFLLREMTGELEVFVRNYCKDHNIPLSKVPEVKLDKLSNRKIHQGIIAIISPIAIRAIEESLIPENTNDIVVVLDGVTDVGNMGAVARSALAFGCKGLVITTKGSGAINKDSVKASAGALLQLTVCREKNIMVAIEKLQQLGYTVLTTELSAKKYLHDCKFDNPIAVVMGSEDKGVSREASRVADMKIKLPQESSIDSLNVSVATGICLYELYKRKL